MLVYSINKKLAKKKKKTDAALLGKRWREKTILVKPGQQLDLVEVLSH